MKKEIVDQLLGVVLDVDSYVEDDAEINITTSQALIKVLKTDEGVQIYLTEDCIQINKENKTILVSYAAMETLEVI